MKKRQNIFDNEHFFEGYKKIRQKPYNANVLEEFPAIMSLCPDINEKAVLDLGCGYGEKCKRFSEMKARLVIGIDISEKMLEIANKENKAANIKYFNSDMMTIDALNEKFDVVISSLAIHYIDDFKVLISKIYSVLKGDGVFIFSQEHPLTTAPIKGVNWTKDEHGNILHYNLTDYCRNGERKVSWLVDGVIKYHRCFSKIVNELTDAGFAIERMLEPVPPEEVVNKFPSYRKDIDKPNFLIIRARKTLR